MKHENKRGLFGILSTILILYFALMGISLLVNGSIGPEVLATYNGQWRNDPANPLLRRAYWELLAFILAGAALSLGALVVSIKDYHRTYHESSLCMIIASCLLVVLNVIPGIYIALFDHVIALNYYNVLMYTGPLDLKQLYPLYAVFLAVALIWIFRTVYRFKRAKEPEAE